MTTTIRQVEPVCRCGKPRQCNPGECIDIRFVTDRPDLVEIRIGYTSHYLKRAAFVAAIERLGL